MEGRSLTIINVTLFLTAIILFISFLGINLPPLGQVGYWLDQSTPVCVVHFQDQKALLNDEATCCLGIQSQLKCETEHTLLSLNNISIEVDKNCFTNDHAVSYLINSKQYNLCKQKGFI